MESIILKDGTVVNCHSILSGGIVSCSIDKLGLKFLFCPSTYTYIDIDDRVDYSLLPDENELSCAMQKA